MKIHPNALPCLTTADEMKPLLKGLQVAALANLLKQPPDPNQPEDLQLLENMKLWDDKEAFLAAELKRIKAKFKRK